MNGGKSFLIMLIYVQEIIELFSMFDLIENI